MINRERRKRVMQRSMRLGHCICDPKKPCPCNLLKTHDVCLCAGERLPVKAGPVRLTRLVESAGCASKVDQALLKGVLQGLPAVDDPRVLVGMPAGDDAGVYQLTDDLAMVQTVDVFTPSVDDPYLFGQVAAANSVSDVYAMGGRPVSALSIIGFPVGAIPDQVMADILRGGIDKMAEAGVPVIGGHSIKDAEIKAGFAVTGLIDPGRIMTNAGARPGDALVLTKPLGTGIIAFAAQIDRAPEGAVAQAAAAMTALNKAASELMCRFEAHACTDVTGFGLAGHLTAMAAASGVDVEVTWDELPLIDGALQCAVDGILSGGAERNRESCGASVDTVDGVPPVALDFCFDPQTSGGLLIALPAEKAPALVAELRDAGYPDAAAVGEVLGPGAGRLILKTTGVRSVPRATPRAKGPAAPQPAPDETEECCMEPVGREECCAPEHATATNTGAGSAGTKQKFQAFLGAANAPGELDAYTKRIVAIALSILAKCEPCARMHIAKARQMGISQGEIEEAAWLAISFGGSPLMLFYESLKGDGGE
jgi:selenide,water dikinase